VAINRLASGGEPELCRTSQRKSVLHGADTICPLAFSGGIAGASQKIKFLGRRLIGATCNLSVIPEDAGINARQ
jgi:hypothetical protein